MPQDGDKRLGDICEKCGEQLIEEYDTYRNTPCWQKRYHDCIESLRERIEQLEEIVADLRQGGQRNEQPIS
jgi:transcription initiation factor IIE alpha subunit